jgi:Zn finger protein HypA/HybF involved in hydrogenase expression
MKQESDKIFKCTKCDQTVSGWSKSTVCPQCGGILIEIKKEEK